jgi:hypothetical protein
MYKASVHLDQTRIKPQRTASYKNLIPRWILRVFATGLIVAIIGGSFLPGKEKHRLGTQQLPRTGKSTLSGKHRLYHFLSFGLAALTLLLLARGTREEIRNACLIFALGCLIEVTQSLIPKRQALEWWDIRDDLYAISGMFILIQISNQFTHMSEDVELSPSLPE